jgi:hypothetical protein
MIGYRSNGSGGGVLPHADQTGNQTGSRSAVESCAHLRKAEKQKWPILVEHEGWPPNQTEDNLYVHVCTAAGGAWVL